MHNTGVSLCLASQEECMPSSLNKDKAKELKQSWRTHSGVFVAPVALHNKFPLSSRFSKNPGSHQRRLHMLCRPQESTVYGCFPCEKLWEGLQEYGVDGCLLLAV